MAKYEINYSCGHTGYRYIGGKRERAKKIQHELHQFGLCPDCKEKIKDAGLKEEDFIFPHLTETAGKNYRIDWAQNLRTHAWINVVGYLRDKGRQCDIVALRYQRDFFCALTDASDFIHRIGQSSESWADEAEAWAGMLEFRNAYFGKN